MSPNIRDALPFDPLPLDESLYSLDDDELAFFKSQTGIDDDEQLKNHILAVQAKAYQVYRYPCIRRFSFIKLKIPRLPAYKHVLQLSRQRQDAILLDIGCCFGNDLRKIVVDGWPVENVLGSDLRSAFWDCGHALFKSTPETFPAAFVPGDAFDPSMIASREPFYQEPQTPRPDLKSLTSLTPLQGHVSAIHASSFFHLFDEEKQLYLARQLATLLSSAPGSVIFGGHGGKPAKGARSEVIAGASSAMFCHSPESWRELWDGQVFTKGAVHVETTLIEIRRPDLVLHVDKAVYWLLWSVTRL
ncbi:hypothetical protein AX17_002333 [Amanita inopinata Kibby_2008]|nr:hypothetical protein AX17_002333 [Amanita inopinata Kibby_2008]